MVQGRPPTQEPSFQGSDLSSASSDAAYGTYFLGRYRVVDEIGVGGMASVHLARMDGAGGFQKWVAIKRIHPHLIEDEQFIHMFLDEARIAARISHPNVAQVFDLGVHENTYWIAMEYLHGEPLREVMRFNEEKGFATNPDLAARIIADAAEGLHAAHELRGKDGEPLNLVHRDVSPHNLFLTYEGMVKVVDFGIAKVSGRLSSTRAGTLKGKLAYMSPEQVRGSTIDRRTDIFALGVVLWEMTTGQRLFRMDSDLETLEKVQACVVPPPSTVRPDFPAELESVIMRALQKRREVRFQTARELSRALQQYLMRIGQFVGPEEVSVYVTTIFGDRIRKREAHLRWAAEVTQTISLQDIQQAEPSKFDEISLLSYDDGSDEVATRCDTAPQSAVTARSPRAPLPPADGEDDGGVTRAARPPRRDIPAPKLPPAHGIHMPAQRLPPEKVNQPQSSVVISGTPPANPLPGYDEDDEDEDIATIVVPSRASLEQGGVIPAAGAPPPAPMPAAGSRSVPLSRIQQTMPPGQAAMRGYPNPYAPAPTPAPMPASAPGGYVQQGFMPPGVSAPPPQSAYAMPPGMYPVRTDETVQLPPVRANHMLVYAAAALGTFFVVVGVAGVILLRSRSTPDSTAGNASAPTVTGTADPRPVPSPIAPPTATAVATATPATATATATAARTTATIPTQTAPATTKTVPRNTAPPATTTAPVAKAEPGFLTVVCNPFCDSVSAGGRNLGPSPVVNVPLPPGQYSVVLRRAGGSTKVVPAVIVSGKTTSHRVSMN